MEWIDGNIGAKINMKYPSCILKGQGASGSCISVAVASNGQYQDAGAKAIHLAPNTSSNIVSKSIAASGGVANYRGKVYIDKAAENAKSIIKCDTILLDKHSKSDTIPTNIVDNPTSYLEHEATVSKLDEEKLFYLMSRGLNEDRAKELANHWLHRRIQGKLADGIRRRIKRPAQKLFLRRYNKMKGKWGVIVAVIIVIIVCDSSWPLRRLWQSLKKIFKPKKIE